MSIKLMTAIWEMRISTGPKLVFLALADWADDEGARCFPSIARIAERASISPRQAQRYMRTLESEGWISIVGNYHGGRESRRYQLHASRVYEEAEIVLAKRHPRKRTPDTFVTPHTSVIANEVVTHGVTSEVCTHDTRVTQSVNTHQQSKNDSRSMDPRDIPASAPEPKRGRLSHGVMCWDDEHEELLRMIDEYGPEAIASAVQTARAECWKARAHRKHPGHIYVGDVQAILVHQVDSQAVESAKSKLQQTEKRRHAVDQQRQLEHDASLALAARAMGVAVNDGEELTPLERSLAQLASVGIRAR